MGLGLSKQTWRMEPREQEPARTHTHTHSRPRALIHRKRDVLIGRARSPMASKNTLDAKGESCQEHRGMFYLWSYTVYSIHSEGEHQWL